MCDEINQTMISSYYNGELPAVKISSNSNFHWGVNLDDHEDILQSRQAK
jgi:hypothetical protein